jgi:dipeptidyl aminopeptidase/acylaminoacyl peptidase
MQTRFLLPAALLLAACAAAAPAVPAEPSPASSSSSPSSAVVSSSQAALELLPSELSIRHFGSMRLEGTDLELGKPVAVNEAYSRYNISYRSNGLLITGVMNIPAGDGPHPLLIFNHGYIAPSVYTQGRGLKREQDYMARRGFAVLHTDYRGHAGSDESPMTEKVYDGALEYAMDSVNAILAVRAAKLPNVDASRVGMLGHSMGGGVTLAILTGRPDMVDAAVLYAPVHADVWENFWRWRREREEGDRTLEQFKTREENPAVWDALSPQTYLAERMEALGKDFEYVEYDGEGHEFGPQWTDFMKRSAEFFREHLGAAS